jgi:hypothetical protein
MDTLTSINSVHHLLGCLLRGTFLGLYDSTVSHSWQVFIISILQMKKWRLQEGKWLLKLLS